jgi:hypothetical protein
MAAPHKKLPHIPRDPLGRRRTEADCDHYGSVLKLDDTSALSSWPLYYYIVKAVIIRGVIVASNEIARACCVPPPPQDPCKGAGRDSAD